MGKAIEREALQRGHEIVVRADKDTPGEWEKLKQGIADVAIEFTHPDSFGPNLKALLEIPLPVVSGTTGWYDRLDAVRRQVLDQQGAFLYAANFSVGVNILFQLNKRLAALMDRYPAYDPYIEEQHHRHKADGPSGTAVFLGKQILESLSRKEKISDAALRRRPPAPEELSIGFVRAGGIFGKHVVGYTSEVDTVTLSHTAHNRRGFALGAVIGAEWLLGRQGFFEFSQIFDEPGTE